MRGMKWVMRLLGIGPNNYVRRRDTCPEWVKEEALELAKQKREMRANKLRRLEERKAQDVRNDPKG